MAVESTVQKSLEVSQAAKRRWHLSRSQRKALWFYFFQSPWLLGIIFLTIIPIVGGLIISMTNYDGISLATTKLVGMKNYLRMLDDKQAIEAFLRTLVFVLINVPLGMIVSFSLALILNQAVKGRGVFRTVYYLPTLVPIVAVAWIFKLFLASKNGPLNSFIDLFRPGTEIIWIGQANALATVTSMAVWMSFGTGMVIFLAGLQGIPPELEEAAVVDGANRLQVFRNVILPLMTPVIFFQLVLSLIYTFQELLRPILLWSTGQMEATPSKPVYLMMIHVYREIFTFGRFGYGAAILWFNFVVMMGLALFVFWTQKYWVYYTEAVEGKTE
jgi:multiple sugar transport system permease protein